MRRTTVFTVSRWLLTTIAIFTALALVGGVRPRVIIHQAGDVRASADSCMLCDGTATAALVAPTADTVLSAAPPLLFMWAAGWLLIAATSQRLPRPLALQPTVPPPRS